MSGLRLNLGSGGRLLPGYVNIDMLELDLFKKSSIGPTMEYLRADIFQLRKYFASETVDEVRASHFFEHLTHQQIITLLYHIWDLLKPKGRLVIVTPNFPEILRLYEVKHREGDFTDLDLLHTKIFNEEDETFHRSIWNSEIGHFYLTREGFYNHPKITFPSDEEIKFETNKRT